MEIRFNDPVWLISQFFALLALISLFWSFEVRNKIKMMLLIGAGSLFLAISATLLANYSLGVLFGLAAIRNFVFSYIDARKKKGVIVPNWITYGFAGVFAVSTITASAMLWHLGHSWWVELFICVTLLGLIIGNVSKGTTLMRLSFVANRGFNIINHIYFNNIIAVIIAASAISSNVIFYIRELVGWMKRRKKLKGNVCFEPFTPNHIKTVKQWAKHETISRWVDFDDLDKYYTHMLKSENTSVFAIYHNSQFVGEFLAERNDNEVSVLMVINPNMHNLRLGQKTLVYFSDHLQSLLGFSPTCIKAHIESENASSIRCFEECGYEYESTDKNGLKVYAMCPILTIG